MTVTSSVLRWPYTLNGFFKDIETVRFSDIFVSLVPFNYSRRKKRIFKKIMSQFKRRNIFDVSCKL